MYFVSDKKIETNLIESSDEIQEELDNKSNLIKNLSYEVKFDDNTHSYYLAPQKIKVGDKIENGSKKEIKIGNCMPLQDIPVGIDIHNVEIQPGGGGKIARSAGTSVTISGLDGNYSLIKLASGEVRKIDSRSLATIGVLSNPDQKNIKIGKAGRSRWLGRRPHTRGIVGSVRCV